MSRDANGTYTAPTNSWNPAVEGSAIDETDWNSTLDDIETALTDSVSRTGKGTVSAHIDFDENGSAGTPASNVGRLYAADVGGATSLMFKDAAGTVYNLLLSTPGLALTFDTSTTTSSDPGSGDVRFNSATYSSVTEIAIDDLDAVGNNIETFIQNITANSYLIFAKRSGAGIAIYQLVSSSNESGFSKLTVSYIDHDGSFSAADPLSLSVGPAGATGATGSTGAAGSNGVNAGLRYTFDAATSGDPGTGEFLLNNAAVASATAIHLSDTDGDGNDVSAWLATWDDSTNTTILGTVLIRDISSTAAYALFNITGASTDNTTYWALAVTHVASAGTLAGPCSIEFYRAGNKGSDGAGTGDVVGPASATNNGFVKFDGTTGKLVKDSAATVAIGSEVSGLGTGVATLLGTFSSANLAAALTDETGSGAAVFATSPTLVTPTLGVASATTINKVALTAPATGSTLTVADGKTLTVSNSITLAGTDSTTMTFPSTSSTIKAAGKETIFVPAAAMTSRTTNGAASGTTELATNDVMLASLDFDQTTEEGAGFFIAMPKSWNESTVTFVPFWTAASGSGGVVWGLAAYAFSNDDALDTAVSGQQTSTDTLITANDMHIGPESSAITIGGTPAEGDVVYFEITREVANGSDTLTADAKLLGIHVYITTNAATDA